MIDSKDGYKTIIDLFRFVTTHHVRADLLNHHEGGAWRHISTSEFAAAVEDFALGLIGLGLSRGEKVGLSAPSSPFWVIADLGISLAGGVTVPVFNRISPENLEFEIEDTALNVMIVGDEREYEPVRACGKRLRKIVTLGFSREDPEAVTFESVREAGRKRREADPDRYADAFARPGEDDLFTVIYTSGSMGRPKGVMLSHKNLVSQVKDAGKVFRLEPGRDRALSSLPLAHIFERMVLYYDLSQGVPIHFVDDLSRLGELMRSVRPTIMTVVPRLLERVYEKMRLGIEESRGLKRTLGRAAFARAETKDVGEPFRGLRDFLYRSLVYRKLLAALGGKLAYVISGAAALPYDVGRFFLNIGVPLFEGYGLTEAAPVIAANRPGRNRLGTIGLPFPSVEVKLGPDGEILARGPNVMRGYFRNPGETAAALDAEGFLHTGDLGAFDADGYLKITGRKKELFKKSTGEYVPPAPIEAALRRLPLVDTAVVVAENRKYVTCLIFPDYEEAERLKSENGYAPLGLDEFLDSAYVRDIIARHVREVNKHLHHTEEVQKFAVVKARLSVESGEITPTLKVRRGVIEEKFKKEIEAMYEPGKVKEKV